MRNFLKLCLKRWRIKEMDYVIVNANKNVYIRLNDKGSPETCTKQAAQKFEKSKAKNILDNLPRSLKRFHFKIQVVPVVSLVQIQFPLLRKTCRCRFFSCIKIQEME